MFGQQSSWLGQIPLILGPSSWGARMFAPVVLTPLREGVPPYWGEWGVVNPDGEVMGSDRVGPFDTIQEAFDAAVAGAVNSGATMLPLDGWAQVIDSQDQPVGPVT